METEKLIKTNPEYENKNYFIRKLFWNRVRTAIKFSDIKNKNRGKILDIGCGRAVLFKLMNKIAPGLEKVGADVNEDITKLEIKNARFVVIKPKKPFPFKNKYFDEVFSLDCLEHIEKLEPEISEIRRILKNNGLLIITGPAEHILYKLCRVVMKGTWDEVYETGEKHFWNVFQVKKKILGNGFILEKSKMLPFKICPLFAVYKFRKTD